MRLRRPTDIAAKRRQRFHDLLPPLRGSTPTWVAFPRLTPWATCWRRFAIKTGNKSGAVGLGLQYRIFNGSAALRVYFTQIRVVCANTLGMAERRSHGQGVSIIHKGDLAAKVGEAQEILGFAKRFYGDLDARINHLAGHYPSQQQLNQYFESLYPNREDGKNRRSQNVRDELQRLFEEGVGQDIP